MARSTMKHSYGGANTITSITVMGLTVLLLWGEVSRVEGKLVKALFIVVLANM